MRTRFSLKKKIAVILFVVGIAFSLAVSAGVGIFLQNSLTENFVGQIEVGTRDQVHAAASKFDYYVLFGSMLGTRTRVVEYLSDRTDERTIELQGIFDEYAAAYPEILSIYLMDKGGNALISTDRTFIGNNYGFREYFRNAIDGRPDVDAIVGVTSNEFGFYFSHPVVAPNGQAIGVLAVKTDASFFTEFVGRRWISQNNTVMLVDERGVVISSNVADRFLKSLGPLSDADLSEIRGSKYYASNEIAPLQYANVLDALVEYAEPVRLRFYDEEDGETEEVVLEKLEGYPFFLVTEINVDRLRAAAISFSAWVGLAIALVFLILIMLAYRLINRSLMRPLQLIFRAVKRIGSGDFSARVDVRTGNELEELGEALNLMSSKIGGYYADLNGQVAVRTRELERKNAESADQQRAIVNILQDVQEEKGRVDELAGELEKFKLAVDNASDHIVITDADGIVLYGNAAVQRVTGYSLKETLGKKAGVLWNKPMPAAFYKDMWRTLKTKKKVFSGELVNRRKNGELYSAEVSISPILDEARNVKFFLGIERDISQRKAAEQQIRSVLNDLKEKSKKLATENAKDEALFANIGDGIVSTDKNGIVTMVNDSALDMIGSRKSDVVGKMVVDAFVLLDERGKPVPSENRPIAIALATGKKAKTPIGKPQYYGRKDGTRFPVSVIVTPFVLDGNVVGVIETFRDVTFETNVDRMKTEFVSLASHQLRTPLSAINWYAEMLLAGDTGKLKPEQKKYVETIYAGNKRMVDLVNALLNVSRIELGTFAVDPEMTSVKDIAETVFDELQPQITERKLKVTKEYDPSLPTMSLDPKLFRIVVQNLMTNAVKYTPEKGKIALTVKKRKGDVLLSVADTGYGIPKKDQDNIFTKMFRADNVREKDTSGTGLGLYIVKSIVEQTTGGKIWFESEENKGTTFYVLIPLKGMRKKEGSKALS